MRRLTDALKNDTLNGLLFEHEREDEKHLRHEFGYWRMVERRMLAEQIAAEGIADPVKAHFEVCRRVVINHANDITYRETSAKFSASARPAPQPFTAEELALLAEHFAGANDPIAVSILEKAHGLLERAE